MKKTTNSKGKLRIDRETLRKLTTEDLGKVVGGASLFPSCQGPTICRSSPKICWQWPEPPQ